MANLTNAGAVAIASAIAGDGIVPVYNASNSYIGVGDSSTAFAASQTDLQAATNKLRKIVSGAPVRASNVVTYTTTYVNSEAAFAWNEIGVFNASSAGTMLVRKVQALGTKPNTEEWTAEVQVTFTAA